MLIKNRYKLVRTLSEGIVSTVWIAHDKKSNSKKGEEKEVIVKMLNRNYMTSDIDNIIRFKRTLKILSESNLKETAKILATGEINNNYYIVMEKVYGDSLDKYFDEPLGKKIDIFLNIVYAVANIHNLGILHKDLKPQNILINEKNNMDVHIIDFDFSDILKENVNKDKFEGSIKYASPEQIGLIKSNLDKRSDLYSLGVILYQLLTNRLPTDGENLTEFIYNQISKRPKSPIDYNDKLDWTISKIALKLLEKDPKQRYFSAKGLIYDLEKYKRGHRNFELGLFDDGINLKYATKLIGRENELTKITNIFFNLQRLGGKFVLIEGSRGVGKSRLLEEFRNKIIRREIMIINTENIFISNDGEYTIIKDIILLITKKIKSLSAEEQNDIRISIMENIGENTGYISNISPEIERIVGKVSAVLESKNQDKTKKEWEAIEAFFNCVASVRKALVIFISDFESIDEKSRGFFEYYMKRMSKSKVLIFATSRIDTSNNQDAEIIKLDNLDRNETNELISQVLVYGSDKIEKITDIIYRKSNGNPRYSLKMLKQLIYNKILVKKDGKWAYKESKNKDISNAFLDVQIKDILDMDGKELYVLTVFSNIGKSVDINVLSDVLNRDIKYVSQIINRFCELKVLDNDDDNPNQYSFFSEKVRQILADRVRDENERILHERIGNCLEKRYKDNREYILDIYEHFKRADNKDKMEEYAKKVKKFDIYNLNSKLALECFYDVLKIKNDTEYKKMVAKIHYMLGDLDIAAKVFEELYEIEKTKENKLDVLINLINIYNKKQNYSMCEKYIKTALDILGIHITKNRVVIWFKYINELTTISYGKKEENDYIKIGLYIALASYYKGKDKLKSKYFAKKQYNIMKHVTDNKSIKIDAINAFHEYCRNNSTRLLDITIEKEKDLQNKYQIAYTYKLYGEYYERKGDYKAAIDKYNKSANLYKSINNDFCYYRVQSKIFDNDYRLSLYKNAMKLNYEYSNFVKESHKDYNIKAYSNFLKIYMAYNDTKNIEEYKEKIKDFIRDNKNIETSLYIDALKTLGILELEYGTISSAIDYFKNIAFLKKDDTSVYLYLVEAYIEQLFSNDKYVMLEKNIIIAEINRLLRKIRKRCTRIQKSRYYYQKARLYEFIEKEELANAYYRMSIRILDKIDDRYQKARVYLDYAKLLRKDGDKEESNNYLEKAYIIFREIGANKYADRIKRYFYDSQEEQEKKSLLKKLKYATQLEIIIKMNQYISSMLKKEELLDKVLKMAIKYTGAQGGYIFIKNNDTHYMEKKASFFIDDEVYSKNIIYLLQKTGESILTIDALDDERFIDNRSIILNDIKSVMAVPIKYGESIKGICYLSNTLSSGVFNERDLELLELLMNQLAISLENADLYAMAITDGLTGLINNKHFKYILDNEIKRCERHERTLSVGMLDIDYFKKFNDTYGHQAGDYVLSKVADVMKNTFRKSDFVARYGGEEFIVLLPETDIDGAYIVCDRLRSIIENSEFVFGKDKFSVKVSMGVAEYKKHGKFSKEIINAADMALYKSKENGRNRVTKAE